MRAKMPLSAAFTPRTTWTRVSEGSPAVLLLTPVSLDGRIWGRFGRSLSQHVGLVIASWPLHGPASERHYRPTEFDPLDEADHVAKALGVLDLVMASDGDAAAAVHLGLKGRTRAVVLVQPAIFQPLPDAPIDGIEDRIEDGIAALPEGLIQALQERDFPRVGEIVARHHEASLDQASRDLLREVVADNADIITAGPGLARIHAAWPDALGDLSVPVLIVGRRDMNRPDDGLGTARALVARCQKGRLAVIDGHTDYPWLEQPDELLDILRDFLREAVSDS